MSNFAYTELPLPSGFESFIVEGLAETGMTEQQGFVYDPNKTLEDPGQAAIIGAGNTWGVNPYGVKPLHVAKALERATGMPVIGLESVGAHGKQTERWSWRQGYPAAERSREPRHREVMLRVAEHLGLFDRPLHHEGASQAGFVAAIHPAVTGPEDGLMNQSLTLYDAPGMRWHPRSLVLPKIYKVNSGYDKLYAEHMPAYEEPDESLLAYAEAHPEIEHYITPGRETKLGDVDPHFTLERLGARNFTAKRIIAGLVRNPDMRATVITCSRGNSDLSTAGSERRLAQEARRNGVLSRLYVVNPEGLLHQRADDPAVRAEMVSRSIDGIQELLPYTRQQGQLAIDVLA